jgi:hypothetical protein
MLLVTFHGGPSGINNVSVYDKGGTLKNEAALEAPKHGKLSELRAMVLANDLLYVANGAKSESTVLVYEVPSSGTSFGLASTLIGPTLSAKRHFETSIAHPFGIAFDGATCFISNQDTNVVGQVAVSHKGQTGSLVPGPSGYLKRLFPAGSFLAGSYVASQIGILPDVKGETTVVNQAQGGLGVSFENGKVKNSVRDVAIANGILFVCDEPEKLVKMYSLADGSYLGSSDRLAEGPTHFAINNGGLFVSAGSQLYWGSLPQSPSSASLSLQTITPPPPPKDPVKDAVKDPLKIGGISFHGASTVYVPYQTGTGGDNPGGSIYGYSVSQQDPPVLTNGTAIVTSLKDTPEFVLHWSN